MIIDILCNDGSPLLVSESSIDGIERCGVGGAELFLLTLCRGLHDRGHGVTLYNNAQGGSAFPHRHIDSFAGEAQRDCVIVFRSPNERVKNRPVTGKKVWLSCDQSTIGDFRDFAGHVNQVVCISQNHANYFKNNYGIFNSTVIDIPVRTWEYKDIPKKRNACIFTSVPDRGLSELLPIWNKIVDKVPDATLTITSDWSLWSGNSAEASASSSWRMAWAGAKNVNYVGAVSRSRLVEIQAEAEFHLYPNTYDELFCISVAESQVAGAVPVTSRIGALETTNRFGHKIDGFPTSGKFIDDFVTKTVELMMEEGRPDIRKEASKEFDLQKILDKWEAEVFNG